jgi:eukaryotic-like serine/threonine-protein kinase
MPPGDPALPTETARWSVDELIPFGKYILLNKISAGATAAVYRAKIRGEAGFERLLTIKRILPQMAGDHDFVETFVEEAKICARLNHSSICPTYELGKVGESLYLAMEWVAGKDLGAIVRRLENTGKVMPPLVAAWISSRLCDALDYAHALRDAAGKPIGIVHQDLSPSNIVVSYEGQVKLIDFGLAKAAGRAQQTNVDALKQKIGYMSPELVLGTTLDARSDVFGVGVCLYEMVTGRRLFAGADDIATLKLVSSANVPPPSALVDDTPEDLEMIMMRALERSPDRRWGTAGEMGQALAACVAGEDPTFGTRHVAEFMRELFAQDMAAEQRRLNDLLAASKDAALMEQRRRFFTSPQGAAAIAKAEASRRALNTLPPGPKPKAAAPGVDRHTPTEVDSVQPVHTAPRDEELTDDELTTFRPEQRRRDVPGAPPPPPPMGHTPRGALAAPMPPQVPSDEDEPTTFRAPEELGDEEELTTFHTESRDTPATEPTTVPPGPQERAQTPEYHRPAPREVTPVRVQLPPGVTPAFEEEATSYFDAGRRASKTSSQGPFATEEEATHIFFSAEEGIGLIEQLKEYSPPGGQSASSQADLPLGRRRTPSEVRTRTATDSGRTNAPRNEPLPANRPQAADSGGHRPSPFDAAAPSDAPASESSNRPARKWPARIDTLERGPTLELERPRRADRLPLLLVGLVMLLATVVGLIVKTPLGIMLGVRKPTEGAIEVRTVPPIAAAVRLDGIYRGRAPLRLEGVRAGDRMLALEADGYVTVARRVTVEGGNTASVNIALEAQPPAAAPAP